MTRFKEMMAVLAFVTGGGVLAAATTSELPANPAPEDAAAPYAVSRTLQGEVLHESDALAAPGDVEVMGSRLVLADNFGERQVSVLSRADGAIERSFGTKGRGPREFEAISSIDVIGGDRFLVHDPMLQRVTWVDLGADFEGDRWVADHLVKLSADGTLLETAWSRDDGLVGIGAITGGRLAHLNASGRLVRTTGASPVSAGEVSRRVWMQTIQTRLKPNPARTRWAVASRFADRLDIYDAEGSLVTVGDRPFDFDPEDLRDEDDTGAVRFGYLDLTTTDTRIYALFSGRTRAEGSANYGARIHVFDWDGRLLDVWETDARLISVSVTPEGDRLYGIRHAPAPAVVTYALD